MTLIGLVGIFIGSITSRFTSTISILLLLIIGLHTLINNQKNAISLFKKVGLPFFAMFTVVFTSALCSDNLIEAWIRVRIALPLLTLPFLITGMQHISNDQYRKLLYFVLVMSGLFTIGILLNYYFHFDTYNLDVRRSGAIPTPLDDHIRYSLCICLCFFVAIYLWITSKKRALNGLLALYLVFIFIAIHILSVRIAIISLYIGILLCLLIWSVQSKRLLLPVILMIGLVTTPIICYTFIPTFRTKMQLTQHNINMIMRGEIGNYSDTQRLLSYKMAFQVIQKNPIAGTGIGDLKDDLKSEYTQHYPDKNVKYPHNQFITILAGAGLIGLLVFGLSYFYTILGKPFRYREQFVFGSIILLSFMTENTLLNSTGMSIYVFFQLITYRSVEKIA